MNLILDNLPLIIVYGLCICCFGMVAVAYGLLIFESIEGIIHNWKTIRTYEAMPTKEGE